MATRSEEIIKTRKEKLARLRELGINPYPAVARKDFGNGEVVNNFSQFDGKEISLAGRLVSFREHGKLSFGQIQDQSGRIQLFLREDLLAKTDANEQTLGYAELNLLDVGDFVEAFGKVVKTRTEEVSLEVTRLRLLSKAIRPLPSEWHGLKDVEERFRKRYLDLLLNPEVRRRFNIRAKIFKETRNYLDDLGFDEVETPLLHPLYGGANAKPFKTHINALDQEMYLRIAFELYLKRLVIGGYDKVYEIGRDFRNEGVDLTHNPEFTMIEWYEAYADYERVMTVTEGLIRHLAQKIFGETRILVGETVVDVGEPWRKVTMEALLAEQLGLRVTELSAEQLVKYAQDEKIDLIGGESKGQLVFTIFDEKVAKTLLQPTWVIDYPVEVSPLAKAHRSKPGYVERFEGYIGGKEICDGWSELTDPVEQRARFESDVLAVRKKTDEAQKVDEDFLEAMEYGMPPMGGIGIGMDRLTMFFTNIWSIRENIIFPTMRTKE